MGTGTPSSFCLLKCMKNDVISKIDNDSPLLHKAHIGDEIVSINGNVIHDVLDYKYFSYDPVLHITLRRPDGTEHIVRVQKPEGRDLGLEFSEYLMDNPRSCANNCVFCFIDQLPKGMRKTMYFKDDDARLSFLLGNYITLTNLSEREIQRIVDLHISPVNISVHATDPELRVKLLHNKNAGKCVDIMKKFASGGIVMNCQIVCCPGLNDDKALMRTMEDLAALYPAVHSVSIVPVGLTKYREGLYPLETFNKDTARAAIEILERWGDKFKAERGSRTVFPSDEFYLIAKRELPPYEFYEDFPQIENGVGMLRDLEEEFSWAVEDEPERDIKRRVTIPTGEGAYAFMEHVMDFAREKFPGLEINLVPVHNDFFGGTVNVTGLLTGRDLVNRLSRENLGDAILLAPSMLMADEDIFLDDMTVQQLSEKLGVPAYRMHKDAAGELKDILGTAE